MPKDPREVVEEMTQRVRTSLATFVVAEAAPARK